MTRIALVCDYSLEYLGGAQSAFLDQVRVLSEQGHQVTIVAPRGKRRARHEPYDQAGALCSQGEDPEHPAARVDRVEIPASFTLPVVDLPLIRNTAGLRNRLREAFDSRAIEIVHLHSEFGLSAAAIDVAQEMGRPAVQTVHTFFWQAGLRGVLDRFSAAAIARFARWLRGFPLSGQSLAESATDSALRGITLSSAERVQLVISPSSHQASLLRQAGLDCVRVIENVAPESTISPEPLTRVELPLRVAWIGRLAPEKRILEFVEAVELAQRVLGPGQLRVAVIGDGPQRVAVEAAVGRLRESGGDPASIHLLGRVSREQVRKHLRDSHLLALTSLGFDNQPVTVIEALTEARTVLYVDRDLREGLAEGGVLAGSADAAGMADALVMLARDTGLVLEGSGRALQAAKVFSPERHGQLLLSAYRGALERRAAS